MDLIQTYTEQTPYFVAFSMIPTIGFHTLTKLLSYFSTPENVYLQKSSDLIPIIGTKKAENIMKFKAKYTPHRILDGLIKKDIQLSLIHIFNPIDNLEMMLARKIRNLLHIVSVHFLSLIHI